MKKIILSLLLFFPGFASADTVPKTSTPALWNLVGQCPVLGGVSLCQYPTLPQTFNASGSSSVSLSNDSAQWLSSNLLPFKNWVQTNDNHSYTLETDGSSSSSYRIYLGTKYYNSAGGGWVYHSHSALYSYQAASSSCPSNSTDNGTSCTCASGYVAQNGQCVIPPDACQITQGLTTGITSVLVEFNNVNVTASSLGSFIGQNVTTSVPIDGKSCAATGQVTDCGLFPSNNGGGSTLLCHLSGTTYTGSTYNGEQSLFGLPKVDPDATPVQDQHGVCPAGQYGGNVNGQAVCVKPNGSANTTSSTTTNADGSTTTTTSTTSCVGDECTETTTTSGTDAQGNSTGTSSTSTQADKAAFCEDNPNDAACKSGTATASCDAFICDGDAVNCAMLKKQWQDSCKLLNPDTDAGSIFNKAIAGTDGFSIEGMKTGAQIIDVGSFDATGSGWSRSCPADKIINVPVIGSFTISFQQYCPLLNSFSMVLLSITLLACIMWCVKD